MSAIKALFLDRDGVVNIDKEYLYKIEDFEFCNGLFDILNEFKLRGFKFFIVTNQSGIGRGYYSVEDFNILTNWMIEEFSKRDIEILDVQYCPHKPDEECECRKPQIGMLNNILENYEIDLKNSWMIGDKKSDMQFAKNGQIKNKVLISPKPEECILYHMVKELKDIKGLL